MSKIELTLSSDYVPAWTLVDAVRELFQNALDQEVQNPDNIASWEYNDTQQKLRISNKKSVLTTKSLLLGSTTKASDAATIGQFGEGYKVATLVLLRNQKNITFYNYGCREIWRPRFVKSRRFDSDILTFFIDKKAAWSSVPSADLVIDIDGITPEEYYEQLVPANLHLQPHYPVEEATKYGQILPAASHAGLVFVNGLYICKYAPYKYGYNFNPDQVKLDRDRKLLSDFDLKWLASKMWSENTRAISLVEEGIADVEYLNSMTWLITNKLSDEAFTRFRQVHGPHAVPVVTQAEADAVPPGYKPVIVSYNYMALIKRSGMYNAPQRIAEAPLDKLWTWYEEIQELVSDEHQERFEEIYKELKGSGTHS